MTIRKRWLFAMGGLVYIVICLAVSYLTRLWVITAAPIGFLFGFFLQKGDLCGSSAFSEVILMRDKRKVAGLWVLIVVSMFSFALGEAMGWIKLNPKPLVWGAYLVGGIIFGAGTVLAGGCISGCLFKAATGNLNSIVAILTMPVGISFVEYGPISGWVEKLMSYKVSMPGGDAVSLPAITGIPYRWLAVVFALVTLIWGIRHLRRSARSNKHPKSNDALMTRILFKPWKPWHTGVAIGILALFAYVSSANSGRNYPLGVTHGVLQIQNLFTDQPSKFIYQKEDVGMVKQELQSEAVPGTKGKKIVLWLVLLVINLMLGAFASGMLTGNARLLQKPPDEILVAILGGFLVGAGAAIAKGCVVGNIMSGWALMSIGNVIFGIVTVLSNWAVTYIYLIGIQNKK